jgi:hypothetical protein
MKTAVISFAVGFAFAILNGKYGFVQRVVAVVRKKV